MERLTNWSFSRYEKWKKCPAIVRFDMENKAPYSPHPAAVRGTNTHKTVEDYLCGRMEELPPELTYYGDFFDALKEAKAVAELTLAVDAEWNPIGWEDPGRWWRGVLDCVVEISPEFAIIYDWKTGNEYAESHKEQREIYAAAYYSHKPTKRIQVYDTYFDKKLNTHVTYEEEDILTLRERWKGRVAPMLEDEAFVPNPGYYCLDCRHSRRNNGPCKF